MRCSPPRSSPSSRDGYFEMGLGESCSPLSPAELQPRARDVRWCFWVEVEEEKEEVNEEEEEVNEEKEEVEQKAVQQKVGCLVFTDQHLGLFSLSADSPWTNHSAGTNAAQGGQACSHGNPSRKSTCLSLRFRPGGASRRGGEGGVRSGEGVPASLRGGGVLLLLLPAPGALGLPGSPVQSYPALVHLPLP